MQWFVETSTASARGQYLPFWNHRDENLQVGCGSKRRKGYCREPDLGSECVTIFGCALLPDNSLPGPLPRSL